MLRKMISEPHRVHGINQMPLDEQLRDEDGADVATAAYDKEFHELYSSIRSTMMVERGMASARL